MNLKNNSQFKIYYEKYSKDQLRNMMDLVYNSLSEKFDSEVSFGFNGCKDFLGAILLLKYDKSVEKDIGYGLCMVFDNKWDTLDFSDFMTNVIFKSCITMEEWIDVYYYLEKRHRWIESHKSA